MSTISKIDKNFNNFPSPRAFSNNNILGAINSNREHQTAKTSARSDRDGSLDKSMSKKRLRSMSREEAEHIKDKAHQKMMGKLQKLKLEK